MVRVAVAVTLAAARHRIWLVGANWNVDGPEPWFGYGFSEIVSPRGEIVAHAKTLYGSEIVYATIRTAWPATEDRK